MSPSNQAMRASLFSLILSLPPVFSDATTIKKTSTWPQISAINHVSFVEGRFDNAFAGNGFLLTHKGRTYAVTAKHVLLLAKTDDMSSVSLEGKLKFWRMHPNGNPKQYIELGRLLNADPQEALDGKVIESDWLVFEVRKNRSTLQPLVLRETARSNRGTQPDGAKPKEGETLYAVGCTYARRAECTQDVHAGKLIGLAPNNLLIELDDTKPPLGGLSGAPVVDSERRLVGIVSNFMPNPKGEGDVFAPASVDYLLKVLEAAEGRR